jgi:IS1 family transposase/transposase-like protein
MNCNQCDAACIKRGVRKQVQQYYCKTCHKYQRSQYRNKRVTEDNIKMIITLHNEGVGINGIARILHLAASTVNKYLKVSADSICSAPLNEIRQEYEIDEMRTYVKSKTSDNVTWIMYAINKKTRRIIHFIVGRRTKENIQQLIRVLSKLNPKRIYTDGLNIYPTVINRNIHRTSKYGTNRIERKNLTLRTHLKRLSRKTICFSKSIEMLNASLKIYFAYKG